MSFIIAATNFSEVADNAVHYACKLAQDCNASVMVLHSFIIPVTFGETPMPVMPIDEGRAIAEERMEKLIVSLHTAYPDLDIASKISYGDVVDSLEEITANMDTALVVIGNSGYDDDMLWLGSNVVSAMRHLRLPVLAIPQNFIYYPISNLCYACDFKQMEEALSSDITRIAKMTHAKLHILNISSETGNDQPEHFISLSDLNPVYHQVANEHTDEAIQSFIDANKMDWLIVVPHKHTFFERLFHKSHTKAMIKTSHIPVLALHEH